MFNKINIAKAFFISTLCSIVYQYYFATAMFVHQFSTAEYIPSRLEAFIEASRVTLGFWPRVFEAWLQSFVLVFFACLALLWWARSSTPNQSLNTDAQTTRAR